MPAPDLVAKHHAAVLYETHHRWLSGWIKRRLGNVPDVADVAQDTFLAVLTSGVAPDIREPRPFFVTIARRLLAHRHRRQLLETSYLEMLAAMPQASAPSAQERLEALETLQAIDRALEGLPDKAREAFLLAHLEALSYAEIARRLKVSTSSVKQYLTRANRQCLFAIAL